MTTDLLTVDELRGYILDSAETDETLQQRLDDTAAELDRRFGPLLWDEVSGSHEPVSETVYAYGLSLLPLRQAAASVSEVTDVTGSTSLALLEADYQIRGRHLERAGRARWGGRTTVVYVPEDQRAARRRVLLELVKLDMSFAPGMASQGGGGWSEAYAQSYNAQREDIMASHPASVELFA